MAKASALSARKIALDLIGEPKGIVRLDIDPGEIESLAENIQSVGLLQPIIVRPDKERFEIVFGHRRYLAHKVLKAPNIACIVRSLSDMECAIMRGTENIQRVDLSPIEEAAIYSDLLDSHNLSYNEIGKRMSKSPGVVRRRMDLLRMPPQLQKAIHSKQISYGVAEALWSIGDIGAIDYYLGFAIEHGATVAVARVWAKDAKDAKRREQSDVERGGGPSSPAESRPVYVTCDLCSGPMEVGKETIIRSCPECTKLISDAVKG
jgi:ParB/RepB/Spo0J family partition protein